MKGWGMICGCCAVVCLILIAVVVGVVAHYNTSIDVYTLLGILPNDCC